MNLLSKIKPSKQEFSRIIKLVDYFLKMLNKESKDTKAIIGGSIAKDTWLKGNHDIDIFVIFGKSYKNKDISKILFTILKRLYKKIEIIHGSRDYYQIKIKNYIFEVIPVMDISKAEEAENIMDISPLHIKWVNSNIGGLADDVRLTKAFCMANKIYGAESYISGLSGYVLEILTIYYNGFNNLIKNAAKWNGKVVIDIEKYNTANELNRSKIYSPLIIIDPVQNSRNAAAALSKEKFNKFIDLCKSYIKKPSNKYFVEKGMTLKELKKKKRKDALVLCYAKPLEGKKDIIGAKLVNAFNYIKKHVALNGFNVLDSGFEWNKNALFWYIIRDNLSKYEKHYGPPLKNKEHLEKFKQKWVNYEIKTEKDRVYIDLPRKYTKVKDYISGVIKDENIIKNLKAIKTKTL